MNDLVTIELKGVIFFAYHGLYPEEKKLGNEFSVDLFVSYQPKAGIITGISDTINYVQLYAILENQMQQPRELLETLAMEIESAIHAEFPEIRKLAVAITKLCPPIAGFTGTVGTRYEKEY